MSVRSRVLVEHPLGRNDVLCGRRRRVVLPELLCMLAALERSNEGCQIVLRERLHFAECCGERKCLSVFHEVNYVREQCGDVFGDEDLPVSSKQECVSVSKRFGNLFSLGGDED